MPCKTPFLLTFDIMISLCTILILTCQLFPILLLARGSYQSPSLAPPPANHWTLMLVRIKTDGSGFVPYTHYITYKGKQKTSSLPSSLGSGYLVDIKVKNWHVMWKFWYFTYVVHVVCANNIKTQYRHWSMVYTFKTSIWSVISNLGWIS